MSTDDRELAERFRRGDGDTLRSVYDRFGGPVFAVAMAIVGDRTRAADAAQAAFVKAWNARDTFDPHRPLGPWLFTITRHCALDIVRRDRRADDVEPTWFDSRDGDADDPAASAERAWTLWEVRRAIDTLPQGERDVVRLGSLAGLSHPEIAEQLGIPIGTVKSRSNRAHQRLAAALEHVHGANHDALSGVEHDSGRRHGT